MDERLLTELREHQATLEHTVEQNWEVIGRIADAFVRCFQQGNKVLICGNGGSAADAQHVAAEMVNQFKLDRAALPTIALTTDTSILTCIGNDRAFEFIFSRQVQALGKPGDLLVGISTSGSSRNIQRALKMARGLGMITIGFTSEKGGRKMASLCDLFLVVPSPDTARIQECHLFVWHHLCNTIEQRLFQTN
jgi:D-sedoheptulose 7-phosphate isomerase